MHTRRTILRHLFGFAALGVLPASGTAARAETPSFGSTQALRQDAQRALPFNKLTPQGQALATRVLNDVTLFRRLPTQVVECDPEMFGFLIDHPDVVINMWEVMGVTKVTMQRLGEHSFRLDDGNGTTGNIHYLYRSPSQHIVYCEGTYTGTLFPRTIRGRCILSLRNVGVRNAENRQYVQARLDSFVQLDNVGVEIFAKTFQNAIGTIADHNFRETTGFASNVSRAAEASPDNIHRMAAKLQKIAPETRQEFTAIGDRIAAAASVSQAQRPTAATAPR